MMMKNVRYCFEPLKFLLCRGFIKRACAFTSENGSTDRHAVWIPSFLPQHCLSLIIIIIIIIMLSLKNIWLCKPSSKGMNIWKNTCLSLSFGCASKARKPARFLQKKMSRSERGLKQNWHVKNIWWWMKIKVRRTKVDEKMGADLKSRVKLQLTNWNSQYIMLIIVKDLHYI